MCSTSCCCQQLKREPVQTMSSAEAQQQLQHATCPLLRFSALASSHFSGHTFVQTKHSCRWTAPPLRCYKDPWQVKWEPQHKRKATQAAAASGRAALIRSSLHGAGSSRVWPIVVPPGLSAAEVKQRLARWDDEEKFDKMTEAFGTFMIHVVPVRFVCW
jgi:hypothetical protein